MKVSFLNAGSVQQYLMYPLRGEWLTFKSEAGFDWIKKFPLESKLLPGRHYKFSLQLTAQLVFLEVSSKKWRKYGFCHIHYLDNHPLLLVPFWTNRIPILKRKKWEFSFFSFWARVQNLFGDFLIGMVDTKKSTTFCIFALFLIWRL